MVLISLHPFAFKKVALVAVAILGLSSVVCFGDSLFMARRYAPEAQRLGPNALGECSPITGPSEPPSAAVGFRNVEKGQPEPTSFIGIERLDITPIVNQVGHTPACIRRTQTVSTVRPI
jgi:hypothetical protein